ncbi:Retrovirus-related Pol polyprotein from transposon TNT 1-94 [Dendrobium catenatum]|uniref:Retrovirus-related Pol polyprotein from transposon TNT 1-94 n=1 Tax=Dendrobium catenatum TaxID=906689 RepID=A0A2I0XFR6_9ASPA|nr:Retrovirus-related Pol polyprotein from transposon TNT 1-94 [Dendrobium catenatum]
MTLYLTNIKSLVDQIASAGSNVDTEDIILYIMNGLPASFHAFKTAIRIMLTPISLDQLYPLLLSEEVNIAAEAARTQAPLDPNLALYTQRAWLRQTISWHRLNVNYAPVSNSSTNRAMVAAPEPTSNNNWFLDSSVSSHLTNSLDNLSIASPYQGSDSIIIGDCKTMAISNSDAGLLPTPSRKLNLAQILHIPTLKYNLLYISKLMQDNNIYITFDPNGFIFKDIKTRQILLHGPCHEGLYPIKNVSPCSSKFALMATSTSSYIWHNQLGHPHNKTLNFISHCNPELRIHKHKFFCTSCTLAKSQKLVFDNYVHRRNNILELVHSNVWGLSLVVSAQGYKHYVIFVDDHSRFTWLYPMIQKYEVTNIFINLKKYIEKLTSKSKKCLRTDGDHNLINFLKDNGISHQMSCPYTPEQNGISERKH